MPYLDNLRRRQSLQPQDHARHLATFQREFASLSNPTDGVPRDDFQHQECQDPSLHGTNQLHSFQNCSLSKKHSLFCPLLHAGSGPSPTGNTSNLEQVSALLGQVNFFHTGTLGTHLVDDVYFHFINASLRIPHGPRMVVDSGSFITDQSSGFEVPFFVSPLPLDSTSL